ncbi:hypothetical protein C4D60_Mb06t37570 [Musa balbisiana]|uniref:Uncharacterized protein n=1 Tax=Musa balbisiana TaxID=52838 RepID=A0A4V4H4G5_MUSBA|nr:hypothetical protein C4D60_Mb06t37570 [Musa balbisiana]
MSTSAWAPNVSRATLGHSVTNGCSARLDSGGVQIRTSDRFNLGLDPKIRPLPSPQHTAPANPCPKHVGACSPNGDSLSPSGDCGVSSANSGSDGGAFLLGFLVSAAFTSMNGGCCFLDVDGANNGEERPTAMRKLHENDLGGATFGCKGMTIEYNI